MVYDPEDPHAALYDVDDGLQFLYHLLQLLLTSVILPESTVITLADWYFSCSPFFGLDTLTKIL